MTPAEKELWKHIRGRRLDGLKFRRQHALGVYILDFICTQKRLIIEVDGDVHNEQVDYDTARTNHLEQYGYQVLRFRNDQILNDLGTVLEKIRTTIRRPETPDGPLEIQRQDPALSVSREGTEEGAS